MMITRCVKNEFDLQKIERKLFQQYFDAVEIYQDRFSKLNCHVLVEACWGVGRKNAIHLTRPSKYKEYVYWISYSIFDQDNHPILLDEESSWTGESEGVLTVKKKISITKGVYYLVKMADDDMSDFLEELHIHYNLVRKVLEEKD